MNRHPNIYCDFFAGEHPALTISTSLGENWPTQRFYGSKLERILRALAIDGGVDVIVRIRSVDLVEHVVKVQKRTLTKALLQISTLVEEARETRRKAMQARGSTVR